MLKVTELLRKYWLVAVSVITVGVVGYAGYGCGARSRDAQVAELSTQLASNEHTIEIKDGLYATKIVEMGSLTSLLDTKRAEVAALKKQLDDSKAQLLTTQQLVVQWKKAYEGAVNAQQTDVPGSDPTVTRKKVTFDKDFGPIAVNGYTLTDPPEGFVSVRQTRPLKLTVSVAKNKDGTWSSYVTSSEPDMAVNVALGAVDPGVMDLGWRQRIWLDAGIGFLGDKGVSLGLSYHFDRVSIGAQCGVWANVQTCGASVGFRLFK